MRAFDGQELLGGANSSLNMLILGPRSNDVGQGCETAHFWSNRALTSPKLTLELGSVPRPRLRSVEIAPTPAKCRTESTLGSDNSTRHRWPAAALRHSFHLGSILGVRSSARLRHHFESILTFIVTALGFQLVPRNLDIDLQRLSVDHWGGVPQLLNNKKRRLRLFRSKSMPGQVVSPPERLPQACL